MMRKSFGLSDLFVTLKSDVILNTLKRIIVDIGITNVDIAKSASYLNPILASRRIDRTARRMSEIVSGLDIILAMKSFIFSYFC